MEREELEEQTVCSDCGGTVDPSGTDRSFAAGDGVFLCWECAEKRGGSYDEHTDRWVVPPDVSGLFDERRPHP
jgi:hypothetical protein